ncbi:MAG: aspartate-semialdehyde dehydrogenase [Pseudomonadota bacterium]
MHMRLLILPMAALALVSCDSGEVPSPTEQQTLRPPSAQIAGNEILLRRDGLVAGAEAFYFAAGQSEVEAALARAVGPSTLSIELNGCSADTIESVRFAEKLSVNFRDGRLIGWYNADASETIRLDGDVQVGMSRDEAEQVPALSIIGDNKLGTEFSLGDEIGGFFDDGAVYLLYAGTQCFER